MVNPQELINQVDVERIYQHIQHLEGIKHPLDTPNALEKAANYILNYMKKLSLETSRQGFTVEGMDQEFYNLIGSINEERREPTLLVTSHYDTLYNTPGADDNASAVAVMLEVARVLKINHFSGNVKFVSFNLEEGSPYFERVMRDLGLRYGILNEQYQFSSWKYKALYTQFQKIHLECSQGKLLTTADLYDEILNQLEEIISDQKDLNYFKERFNFYLNVKNSNPWGDWFVCGSGAFAQQSVEEKQKILGVLNLESIGYCSKIPNSQRFPTGLDPAILPKYNTNENLSTGDFIVIVSDDKSANLAESFFNCCQKEEIGCPVANLTVPFDFEFLKLHMRDLLRSDHAPFWRHGIKGLMISDSANFRNPYYHTPADTIDTLDFDFLGKIAQTTLATILELSNV